MLGDFVFHFTERLLTFVVVLEHLQDQIALLGVHHVGEAILLHAEDLVFKLLGKFAALVDAQEAALFRGAAVG